MEVEGPLRHVADIDLVGGLWRGLHAHHQRVARYPVLVRDLDVSWERRRQWYRELLEQGGALWIAYDPQRRLIGYAFATLVVGPDDTFDSRGTAELVSLIVDESHRGSGVGRALVNAVEAAAHDLGIDLFKVAVMAGNDSALRFYGSAGFELGEQVLYRRIP